jgi:hypothetical protein
VTHPPAATDVITEEEMADDKSRAAEIFIVIL